MDDRPYNLWQMAIISLSVGALTANLFLLAFLIRNVHKAESTIAAIEKHGSLSPFRVPSTKAPMCPKVEVRFAPETFRECITPWHLAAFSRELRAHTGSLSAKARLKTNLPTSQQLGVSALPRFIEPAASGTLWTEKSLQTGDLALLVTLAPPSTVTTKNDWRPVLDVTGSADHKTTSFGGHHTKNATHTLRIPVASFVSTMQPGEDLDLRLAATALTDPLQVHAAGDPAQVLDVRLASLADLASVGPLKIRLTPGDLVTENKKNWFTVAPEPGNDGSAPLVIQLLNSRHLTDLSPLLRGAQSLTIKPTSGALPEGPATCYARAGQVIACAWGSALDDAHSQYLAQQLGARLAYRGHPEAFLGQPRSPDELAILTTHSGKHIFVYEMRRGFRSYPVPAPFIAKSRAAADFLADGSTALFSEKVQLLPTGAEAEAAH